MTRLRDWAGREPRSEREPAPGALKVMRELDHVVNAHAHARALGGATDKSVDETGGGTT